MDDLTSIFNRRQKALQGAKWLRPTLLLIDFFLLIAGLVINPVLGFILGFIFILINEFFTPVVVKKVFFTETNRKIKPKGRLTKKVIRGLKPRNKSRD